MSKSGYLWPLAAACMLCGGAAIAKDLPAYPEKAHVIEQLKAFDHPESAIFSEDGTHVFVSNAAVYGPPEKSTHWTHNAGYVSKLAVQPDGTLKMEKEKLVDHLTGPLGFAVLPVDVGRLRKGTIFEIEAWAPLVDPDGKVVKDPKLLDPKIIAFDESGKMVGAIPLGKGSAAEKAAGVIATQGNALAFDKQGNLYATDTGVGGDQFEPPIPTKGGGVYMFPASSLEALVQGKERQVYYIPVPQGGPDGIAVAPDGSIQFNTVGEVAKLNDPAHGGMYRMTIEDFKAGKLPRPFETGLGALDGCTFAGNLRLDTEIEHTNSVIVTPMGANRSYRLEFDQPIKLTGPADIAVHRTRDGGYLLLIPQLSATAPSKHDNPLAVVKLPAGFEQALANAQGPASAQKQ
ncbi:MAG TPA: hypothetical protein VFB54_02295 [Burkholderiales bacterium]|nr:hypothetical protein [Burkholderiales bacterium]